MHLCWADVVRLVKSTLSDTSVLSSLVLSLRDLLLYQKAGVASILLTRIHVWIESKLML